MSTGTWVASVRSCRPGDEPEVALLGVGVGSRRRAPILTPPKTPRARSPWCPVSYPGVASMGCTGLLGGWLVADLPGGAREGLSVSEGSADGPVIRTPDRRLRVFVSSTLGELAAERRAVRMMATRFRAADPGT